MQLLLMAEGLYDYVEGLEDEPIKKIQSVTRV